MDANELNKIPTVIVKHEYQQKEGNFFERNKDHILTGIVVAAISSCIAIYANKKMNKK